MSQVLVLLNARAGALIDGGPQAIRNDIDSTFSPRAGSVDVRLLQPKQMVRAIREAAGSPHDTIIVGGGDGSASLAAATLAGTDKVLGVLPFGTMNLFASDLGMPSDPRAAVQALAKSAPQRIDLATLNGRPFHSLSGIGFFSQMARAREETRGHPLGRLASVAVSAIRAVRRTGTFELNITIDGRTEHVAALAALVTNNRFGADWRRPRLDAGTLELHLAEDAGALAMLKASAGLLTGTWREQSGIRSITAQEVVIDHARSRTWASTDGELAREEMPLRYALRPRALTVLAAQPA
jgi:diacylglycerol kinase family enzyme